MPRHATLAEYYRAHRAAMELALATGCTPKEAERELRRRAAERRQRCGRIAPDSRAADNTPGHSPDHAETPEPGAMFGEWRAPWMMRD